ncbi:imidazole glycerol phosphate synthase subunit HisH [Corynebacterium sp. MSK008]|uniref:imidazole glycerol phosphate synthase subunit HisH n=1 Tax=Corynebacterium sp. MSK008 TaxID=3050188 RepID=UPI00254DF145|nr:imidazole glycerol phosphate synthase subunit HisH [Corynebacterium sp. MSK008]MDK8878414.1 imidazole glycerol phosphate synthase subunit HisH [Corynebacterium sp. MSK008]
MSETTSSPKTPAVAVFDPFTGADPAVAALCEALRAAGVHAEVTSDPESAVAADGLVVAASGNAAEALRALRNAQVDRVVGQRLAGSRPVLVVGAAMDALFERGADGAAGFGEWPGGVDKLDAPVERAEVAPAERSLMLDGAHEFVFNAATGARTFALKEDEFIAYPKLSWAGEVLAAVENGPLWATRFHPEASGEAGTGVLRNWIAQLG